MPKIRIKLKSFDHKMLDQSAFIEKLKDYSFDLGANGIEEFSNPSRKIEIPDEEAEKIVTVQDMLNYLENAGVEDD